MCSALRFFLWTNSKNMSQEESSQQTVITLDNNNSVQLLCQYVEIAQSKGAFLLQEAEVLKRATDFLLNNVQDSELNQTNAKQLLIQGVTKGQRHGAYTLGDAALIFKVIQYISANQETQTQTQTQQPAHTENDDLADLAEPIPLKPKEV